MVAMLKKLVKSHVSMGDGLLSVNAQLNLVAWVQKLEPVPIPNPDLVEKIVTRMKKGEL